MRIHDISTEDGVLFLRISMPSILELKEIIDLSFKYPEKAAPEKKIEPKTQAPEPKKTETLGKPEPETPRKKRKYKKRKEKPEEPKIPEEPKKRRGRPPKAKEEPKEEENMEITTKGFNPAKGMQGKFIGGLQSKHFEELVRFLEPYKHDKVGFNMDTIFQSLDISEGRKDKIIYTLGSGNGKLRDALRAKARLNISTYRNQETDEKFFLVEAVS